MIRVVRPAVATSVQDQGRVGHVLEGHARSGAMDPLSLRLANRLAGASDGSAGIEIGPGPFVVEITRRGTLSFGGARRPGAPWWQTIEAEPGTTFELKTAADGVWSYVAIEGGVQGEVFKGSRSTHVREGVGAWVAPGESFVSAGDAAPPAPVSPPDMRKEIRIFGELPGSWRVGNRVDRMGYQLEGTRLPGAPADEYSEPVLPGFIQVLASGSPVVLMAEASTVGGYRVVAAVHSEDVRLVAQTPSGDALALIPAGRW